MVCKRGADLASSQQDSQHGSEGQQGSSGSQRGGSGNQHDSQQQGGGRSALLIGIFLLALILLAVYGYYWALSDSGQRTLTSFKEFLAKNNPIAWYMKLIGQAEDIGKNEWSSIPNMTSTVKGLVFKEFRAVSTEEYPQGSPVSLEYVLELKNFDAQNLPVTVDCAIKDKQVASTQSNDGGIIIKPNREFTISGSRIYDDVRCMVSATVTQALEGPVTFIGA
ncbi:MAG: hypothetical protein V1906_00960, partial [Candidatus Woesearchaeota archaeon]